MVSPTVSFSGIASGLDTGALIDSLMTVERAPISRMQARRQEYDQKLAAWTSITSKVSELRTSTDALRSVSDFNSFVKVKSGNEDALSVSITGTPPASGVNVTVNQLAANHQVATGAGFGARDTLVGAGSFSISTSEGDIDITTDSSTTLEGLAQQINSANGKVTASVIEVGMNDHRLLLTAKDSGLDSQFTMTSDLGGFASSEVLTTGADAKIRIGDPVTGLEVTRSSNTFDNVMDGVSFEAKQVTTEPVRIEVTRDTESTADAIKSMVTATNALLKELERQTNYNAESNTSSPLTNDSTARDMILSIRDAMSEVVSNSGNFRTIGDIGIEFERDGSYSVDETKLNDALSSDFESVVALFARNGSSDSGKVSYANATSATQPGTYGVVVDTAATAPTAVGSVFQSPAQLQEFNIQYGGVNALVTVANGSTLQQAIDSINSDLASRRGVGRQRRHLGRRRAADQRARCVRVTVRAGHLERLGVRPERHGRRNRRRRNHRRAGRNGQWPHSESRRRRPGGPVGAGHSQLGRCGRRQLHSRQRHHLPGSQRPTGRLARLVRRRRRRDRPGPLGVGHPNHRRQRVHHSDGTTNGAARGTTAARVHGNGKRPGSASGARQLPRQPAAHAEPIERTLHDDVG